MVQLERQLFTVSEYHKMVEVGILSSSDRVELIRGEIIKMSPINSRHASVVDLLAEELIAVLRNKAIVRIQNPLFLGNLSEPEPDVAIVKYQQGRYRAAHPEAADCFLVVEVAATSLDYDREMKAKLYAEAGIPEYWVINLPDNSAEVFQKPESGQYAIHRVLSPEDTLSFPSLSLEIGLALFF